MASRNLKLQLSIMVLVVGLIASAPAFAGSAVIGSVAGSTNATLSGQVLQPNTTIFSGDSVNVRDGVAIVAIGKTSRAVFGHDTVASFLKEGNDVTVLLTRGNLSVFHPDDTVGLRVKVGQITVTPTSGFRTLGEVAMLNGVVVVTAKEGSFRVAGTGSAQTVAKGKTITIAPKTEQGGAAAAGAGAGARISASTAMSIASVATGGLSAVLSGVALKRAGDAKDAANAANATAATAASNASNATDAANSAAAAASNAEQQAVAAGCTLNIIAVDSGTTTTSPYTPPPGFSAPGC